MREAARDPLSAAGPESPDGSGNPTGIIFDIKRFAIHDGPGIRTTVFFKGCPLTCGWCQNPEGIRAEREPSLRINRCTACGTCVSACGEGAIRLRNGRAVTDPARCVRCGRCIDVCPSGAREIIGRHVTVEEVVAEVRKDVIFYDESGGGVTFSGGEPLAQPEFLRALLAECKASRIHTALDTTCHAPWPVLESVIEHTDLFLCDVKHMDSAAHERSTGVANDLILENLRKLTQRGERVIIRMPVIPGVNDDDGNITAVGRFVSSLNGVGQVDVLPYNEGGRQKLARLAGREAAPDIPVPSGEHMAAVAGKLGGFGLTVRVGG